MDSLNLTATMTLAGLKATKGEPENFVTAKFSTRVESKEAKELLGEDFYRTAFGSLQFDVGEEGAEAEPVFGYAQMRLGEQLQPHMIKLLGHEFKVTPRIEAVTPIKGERAVRLTISAQFVADEDNRVFTGELFQKFDTQFEVGFSPAQLVLPLDGDSADDDAGGASERTPGRKKRAPNGVVGEAKTGPWGNPSPVVG